MKIEYLEKERLCCIWLTREENTDQALRRSLQPLYKSNRTKKITTVVYQSGEGELYDAVLSLLSYNKRRIAELEVCREK